MRGMNQLTQHLRPTFGADSRDAAMTADRFPVAGAGETLRHLRTLVRGRGLRLSVAVAVLIAAAWCGVLVPKLMGGIVDVVADVDDADADVEDTQFCGECGAKNPAGAAFCSKCGHKFGE